MSRRDFFHAPIALGLLSHMRQVLPNHPLRLCIDLMVVCLAGHGKSATRTDYGNIGIWCVIERVRSLRSRSVGCVALGNNVLLRRGQQTSTSDIELEVFVVAVHHESTQGRTPQFGMHFV